MSFIDVFKLKVVDAADGKRRKIKIFGISFAYKTKKYLDNANDFNVKNSEKNLSQFKGDGNKNILFVASDFIFAGGIETRLSQYIEKLSSDGWNCYILSEKNENEYLNSLSNFNLCFDAKNVQDDLLKIIKQYDISIVEFQFKSTKILKNINLNELKSFAKLGCVIHDFGVKDINIIKKFDYIIKISKFMYYKFYSFIKGVIIQNAIDTTKYSSLPTWSYKGQKKAILISRIDSLKKKSIECFIKYCQKNNIEFLIAGEEKNSKEFTKSLIEKYDLKENVFIGRIDTIDYLQKNINNILFVAGIGQVILEGAYLNYPCFCCSDYKNKMYSFLTTENIGLFNNFTVYKNSLVHKRNKKEFILDVKNIEKYQQRQFIIENRDLKTCYKKYKSVIEN